MRRKGRNLELKRQRAKEKNWRDRGAQFPTRPMPEKCELCGRVVKPLHSDHCHLSGLFRGWLCRPCNVAIGTLGDSEEGLQNAINYIRRSYK